MSVPREKCFLCQAIAGASEARRVFPSATDDIAHDVEIMCAVTLGFVAGASYPGRLHLCCDFHEDVIVKMGPCPEPPRIEGRS